MHASVERDLKTHVHLLRPDDVAARLAKSRAWVYRNQHALGGFRIGGQVRFDPQSIEGYLDRCRNGEAQRLDPDAPPLLPIKRTGRIDGGEPRSQ